MKVHGSAGWLLAASVAGTVVLDSAEAQPVCHEGQKLSPSAGEQYAQFGRSVSVCGDVAIIGVPGSGDLGHDLGWAYTYRHDGLRWIPEQKLLASDGAALDEFGTSVSISGDVAIVGAPFDDDDGFSSGSAYVFRYDGISWVEEQKLVAPDAATGDEFGFSVAITGDIVFIGAPGETALTGAVFVYQYDGISWTHQQMLTAEDGAPPNRFGYSVSVSGDVAIIGSPRDDDNGSHSGSAHVYQHDGVSWTHQQKLLAPDGAPGDRFGESSSISGDLAIVGSPHDGGSNSGSAHVYRYDGVSWTQEQKLVASDAAANDEFGGSVSIGVDVAIIGSPRDEDYGQSTGSAYVYKSDGASWSQDQKLLASDAGFGTGFGNAISISGDVTFVGARYYDEPFAGNAGAAYVFQSDGVSWTEAQKLLESDAAANDELGDSVSISGDVAIVGTPLNDDNGSASGSAYVYRRDGVSWVQEQKLLASDAEADDEFGGSVEISDDFAIVGARLDDDNGSASGSAYVYRYEGVAWYEQKLLASDGAEDDEFGGSVSISGDVAIVGARLGDDNGSASGSAYVYRFNGISRAWVEEQKLLASDAAGGDEFGGAVSIRGEVAIVGARFDDDDGSASGSVYVYRYNGVSWVQEQKLLAPDAAANDEFGNSVAISGDVALVGARLDDDDGSASGSAYVYRYDGVSWTMEQKLVAPDAAANDEFGVSVSISGDIAVIGAHLDLDGGAASGSTYAYRYGGVSWTLDQKLIASDAAGDDRFGGSVSISGDVTIVGARFDDDNGFNAGSVYVYDLPLCGCSGDTNGDDVVDVLDFVNVILAWGTDDGSADVTGDGIVDVEDLVRVVLAWGPCL